MNRKQKAQRMVQVGMAGRFWRERHNAQSIDLRVIGSANEARTRIQHLGFEKERLCSRHRRSMQEINDHIRNCEDSLIRLYREHKGTDTLCLICQTPMSDYDPEMCCNGHDCCCRGEPMNPALCSNECFTACMDGVGTTMEERRTSAGIKRFVLTSQ